MDTTPTALLEPRPSDAYAGCLLVVDTNDRYKEQFAAALEAHGVTNGWDLPAGVMTKLQEDHRRALCRASDTFRRPRGEPRTTTAAVRLEAVRPSEAPDGSMTITCRVCDEAKPTNKFPTLSGKPGVRGDVCRACVSELRTASKGGA